MSNQEDGAEMMHELYQSAEFRSMMDDIQARMIQEGKVPIHKDAPYPTTSYAMYFIDFSDTGEPNVQQIDGKTT